MIPPETLESLAKVLSYGAIKYGDDNWKNCTDLNRLWGGIFRHIQSHRMGEYVDEESKNLHLEHAFCSMMMILYLTKKEIK